MHVSVTHLWDPPPADLVLPRAEIHLWRAALEQPEAFVERLAQTLSSEEQARAERYHFAHDRRRFITGRGLLRMILGRYLDTEPERLQFYAGPYGKPALAQMDSSRAIARADPTLEHALRFNVAHSHELALFAFTRDREIGVDIEYVRPITDAEQIAERYFSPQESSQFRSLPADEKYEYFYTCWTRMEARLKMSGSGLAGADKPAGAGRPEEPYRVMTLIPAPGYVAALAVEKQKAVDSEPVDVIYWQWPCRGS